VDLPGLRQAGSATFAARRGRALSTHATRTMGKLGTTEIILIVAVILLIFGGKKIPELMRGLGRGMREFKDAKEGNEPKSEK